MTSVFLSLLGFFIGREEGSRTFPMHSVTFGSMQETFILYVLFYLHIGTGDAEMI
jgi:hypothetical protein